MFSFFPIGTKKLWQNKSDIVTSLPREGKTETTKGTDFDTKEKYGISIFLKKAYSAIFQKLLEFCNLHVEEEFLKHAEETVQRLFCYQSHIHIHILSAQQKERPLTFSIQYQK